MVYKVLLVLITKPYGRIVRLGFGVLVPDLDSVFFLACLVGLIWRYYYILNFTTLTPFHFHLVFTAFFRTTYGRRRGFGFLNLLSHRFRGCLLGKPPIIQVLERLLMLHWWLWLVANFLLQIFLLTKKIVICFLFLSLTIK